MPFSTFLDCLSFVKELLVDPGSKLSVSPSYFIVLLDFLILLVPFLHSELLRVHGRVLAVAGGCLSLLPVCIPPTKILHVTCDM